LILQSRTRNIYLQLHKLHFSPNGGNGKEPYRMKRRNAILLFICGLVVLVGILTFFLNAGMGEIRRLAINPVDLTGIADGVYNGSYHKGRWTYDVQVTVRDHKIVAIRNTNRRMEMFKDFNVKAEAAIVKKQSLQIDVVSSATVNTRAFQKAVETALDSAQRK